MDGTQQLISRIGGRFLVAGGATLALVTWGELFVGPLVVPGEDVVLEPVPARVLHLVSYLGILLIPMGLAALAVLLRDRGRAAVVAVTGVGLGFVLGALPHTVLDWSAIPTVFDRLPEQQARELVEGFYRWIGPVAMLGVLPLAAGAVTLGVLGLRRGVLPRRLAWASLAVLPAAVLLGVLGEMLPDLPVPHPPVAFDLLLVAYGWHLVQQAAVQERTSSADAGRGVSSGPRL